jgi:predicted RNA-binding Zn-ribbon protein involved in translation (DUF1610 family)
MRNLLLNPSMDIIAINIQVSRSLTWRFEPFDRRGNASVRPAQPFCVFVLVSCDTLISCDRIVEFAGPECGHVLLCMLQRARELNVPNYNAARAAYGLRPVANWTDPILDPQAA